MKKWVMALSLSAGVLALSACGNNGDVIVKTDSGDVTKDEFYETMKEQVGEPVLYQLVLEKVLADHYKVKDEEVKKVVKESKEELGENFEMALQSSGYQNEEDYTKGIKLNLLMEKAAENEIKVTDKELKERYENTKGDIKARHILVNDEKTAKEVKKKLDEGKKFEDLAKEYSQDTATAESGGDLEWISQGEMDPAFEEAAFKLEKDEISKPVAGQNGWHIIQVTDKKKKEPFEKMKGELADKIRQEKLTPEKTEEILKKELKKADVDVKDEDLKASFEALLGDDKEKNNDKKDK